jgi:hypothetical protein
MEIKIDIKEYQYEIMEAACKASKVNYLYEHDGQAPEIPEWCTVKSLIEIMVKNYCNITIEKINKSVVFPEPKVATE